MVSWGLIEHYDSRNDQIVEEKGTIYQQIRILIVYVVCCFNAEGLKTK
jgi:hypothetical protein